MPSAQLPLRNVPPYLVVTESRFGNAARSRYLYVGLAAHHKSSPYTYDPSETRFGNAAHGQVLESVEVIARTIKLRRARPPQKTSPYT